jgi:hypothetical protein
MFSAAAAREKEWIQEQLFYIRFWSLLSQEHFSHLVQHQHHRLLCLLLVHQNKNVIKFHNDWLLTELTLRNRT